MALKTRSPGHHLIYLVLAMTALTAVLVVLSRWGF